MMRSECLRSPPAADARRGITRAAFDRLAADDAACGLAHPRVELALRRGRPASPVMAVIVLPWHTWAEKTGLLGCATPRRSTTRLPAYRASGRSESRRDALVRCDLDDIRPADRAEGSAPRAGVARGGKLILGAKRPIFCVVATLGWADPVVGTSGDDDASTSRLASSRAHRARPTTMLATTRVALAPVASSVAQRKPAGRARVASPKRPAGTHRSASQSRLRLVQASTRPPRRRGPRRVRQPRARRHRRESRESREKPRPPPRLRWRSRALATVLGTAYSFPFLWALAIVPCMLGLVNPVYVFSVGYGLSVAAQGIGLLAAAVRVRGLDIQPVPRASPRRRLLRRSARRFPLLAERDVDGVGAAREERAGG